MRTGSGAGLRSLRVGNLLGWVSLALAAVILLLSTIKPVLPRSLTWLPSPAWLLIAGALSGAAGALLCGLRLGSGEGRLARNGLIRGAEGALLNALLLSLTTVAFVVQTP